jgi:hypothetical protein
MLNISIFDKKPEKPDKRVITLDKTSIFLHQRGKQAGKRRCNFFMERPFFPLPWF